MIGKNFHNFSPPQICLTFPVQNNKKLKRKKQLLFKIILIKIVLLYIFYLRNFKD